MAFDQKLFDDVVIFIHGGLLSHRKDRVQS
jgi:hypothetical protein